MAPIGGEVTDGVMAARRPVRHVAGGGNLRARHRRTGGELDRLHRRRATLAEEIERVFLAHPLRDPESKTFYEPETSRAHEHNAALICLARRRCDVILAMLWDHERSLTPAERGERPPGCPSWRDYPLTTTGGLPPRRMRLAMHANSRRAGSTGLLGRC